MQDVKCLIRISHLQLDHIVCLNILYLSASLTKHLSSPPKHTTSTQMEPSNEATRSRFRVTAASELSQETELFIPPTFSDPIELASPEILVDNQYGDFFGPNFYTFTLDEPKLKKEMCHNTTSTNTTTNSSSSSSFYSTIYKYNKLMQNNIGPQCPGGSMDPVFPFNHRTSHLHNALAGIRFYNEKVMVYNFLQRPSGPIAIGYHIGVSILVVYCLVLTIMSTSASEFGAIFTFSLLTN